MKNHKIFISCSFGINCAKLKNLWLSVIFVLLFWDFLPYVFFNLLRHFCSLQASFIVWLNWKLGSHYNGTMETICIVAELRLDVFCTGAFWTVYSTKALHTISLPVVRELMLGHPMSWLLQDTAVNGIFSFTVSWRLILVIISQSKEFWKSLFSCGHPMVLLRM